MRHHTSKRSTQPRNRQYQPANRSIHDHHWHHDNYRHLQRVHGTEGYYMCEKQYTIKDIIQYFDSRLDRIEQQLKQRTVVKKSYTISEFVKAYGITELKVRELIQRGKIKATSDTNGRGTRYLIDAKSAEDWWVKQLGKPIK